MAQPDLPYPPFLDDLADVFEDARPYEKVNGAAVTWNSHLKFIYHEHGASEALRNVAVMLQALQEERRKHTHFTRVSYILADASREEPWRLPFGDCGILDFYLEFLPKDDYGGHQWIMDALRLVGNCCADDSNLNRGRVLAKLDESTFINRLGDVTEPTIAIAVLYNLCLDYEPAQKAATSHQLFPALVKILAKLLATTPSRCSGLPQVCAMLDFAIEEPHPEACAPGAIIILYDTIVRQELEIGEKITLANAIVTLLKHERHQKLLIAHEDVTDLAIIFVLSYNLYRDAAIDYQALSVKNIDRAVQDHEHEEQLQAIRSKLSARLWDITTIPDFAVKYPPTSDLIKVFVSWISASEPERQLCACSVLRNYVCSDEIATEMVQGLNCFKPLTCILMTGSDTRVLEEALRLSRNLALPVKNRQILLKLSFLDRLTALVTESENPNLQSAAISLLRQLIKGQQTGVLLLLSSLPETSTPPTTPLSRLLAHYKNASDLTIRIEIGRMIVEMWRTIQTPAPSSGPVAEKDTPDETLLKNGEDIVEPVLSLITESNNPSLVTEGWFGLNLMASSKLGSEAVWNVLRSNEAFAVLKSAIVDEDSGSKDRDNACILVDKLVRKSAAPSLRRALLESLLSGNEAQIEDINPENSGTAGDGA